MHAIATSSGLSLFVLVQDVVTFQDGLADISYQDVPRFTAPLPTAGDIGAFHFSLFCVL